MDNDFIRRATKVTSFNLYEQDFQSTKYKKEIQTLFNTHFFPNFDLSKTLTTVNKDRLNRAIIQLKNDNYNRFENLHNYKLKGIGPGEVTLYFLLDNAHLGGGSSAGVDLVVGSKNYEIKAVDYSSNTKTVFNFKTGGTFDTSDIINRLMDLKKAVNAGGEGVNATALSAIEKKFPEELKNIKQTYVDRAYNQYFKKEEIIFIHNKKGKATLGNILAVKKIQKNDIQLERVTSGVIKPKVKI